MFRSFALVSLLTGCGAILGINQDYTEVSDSSASSTGGSTASGAASGTSPGGADGSGAGGSGGSGGSGALDSSSEDALSDASGGTAGAAGIDGSAGSAGAGATDAAAGTGGTSSGDAGGCPLDMASVRTLGGIAYCIDRLEVTNNSYAAFLATAPSLLDQPSECAFNTAFEPTQNWPPAAGLDDHPVAYVDWCDVSAYCRANGKRLCGNTGGGSLPVADGANALASQWYNACSSQGARQYPYGNTYGANYCNDGNAGLGTTWAVGSNLNCEGGFTSLFDMAGNVWEWEDSCSAATGPSDTCLARGASYASRTPTTLHCDYVGYALARSTTAPDLGFRCCRD